MTHKEDLNEDGLVDLVLQVSTEHLEELLRTGAVVLTGETYDGVSIEVCDEITIVLPKGKSYISCLQSI